MTGEQTPFCGWGPLSIWGVEGGLSYVHSSEPPVLPLEEPPGGSRHRLSRNLGLSPLRAERDLSTLPLPLSPLQVGAVSKEKAPTELLISSQNSQTGCREQASESSTLGWTDRWARGVPETCLRPQEQKQSHPSETSDPAEHRLDLAVHSPAESGRQRDR